MLIKTAGPVTEVNIEAEAAEYGKATDIISGPKVPATPEEVEAVQPFVRQSLDDYGYPKGHIQKRPQRQVKASRSDQAYDFLVIERTQGGQL